MYIHTARSLFSFAFVLALPLGALAASTLGSNTTPTSVLPSPAALCGNGTFVNKIALIDVILRRTPTSREQEPIYTKVNSTPDLKYRFLTTDNQVCTDIVGMICKPSDTKCARDTAKLCSSYQYSAKDVAIDFFNALNKDVRSSRPQFAEGPELVSKMDNTIDQLDTFLLSPGDARTLITCRGQPASTIPGSPPPTPTTPVQNGSTNIPIRVRGNSDDLIYDHTDPRLSAASSATGSFTDDTTTTHTMTTKLVAATGYAFQIGDTSYFTPFIAANQTLTDTSLKPRTIAATNFVSSGVLLSTYFSDTYISGLEHSFSVKPYYLLNTHNESELVAGRVIYMPTILQLALNSPSLVTFLPGSPWGQFVFDVRNDAGGFFDRGNTPAVIATSTSFDRIGTRAGFSISTATADSTAPSVTLTMTETYLYGVVGYYRTLNNFQAQLTYNPIAKGGLGITGSYSQGRNEDTAVSQQSWTIGLSAKY
jgi:hypothetical protein